LTNIRYAVINGEHHEDVVDERTEAVMNGRSELAKALMPWMFGRKAAGLKPFAKVRCEGGKCVWESAERTRGRISKRAQVSAA
jgi:hypothetical protein